MYETMHRRTENSQSLKRGLGASPIQNFIQIKNHVDYWTKFPVPSGTGTELWFSLHWFLRSPQLLTGFVWKNFLTQIHPHRSRNTDNKSRYLSKT